MALRLLFKEGQILGGFIYIRELPWVNNLRTCEFKCKKCGLIFPHGLDQIRRSLLKNCPACAIGHGHASLKATGKVTSEYHTWMNIIYRCYNPNARNYYLYGGRGITVCARWRYSFENFLADMGLKPSPELTLERIKTNGHYTPKNCKWDTRKNQSRNRRVNVILKYNGESMCLSAWAEKVGIDDNTIWMRLNYGKWSVEKALTTPVRKLTPKKNVAA